jgi:WD40 repeat protein
MTILLSMRSDFVSQCARFPALRALMSKQFQLVGAMEPNDLAKAISLPAMEVGAEIEAALVSRILDDMHGEPGTLPLMSFALRDLFDSEQTETGAKMDLALKEYLDRGGIEQALERHANAVFGTFSDEQQALAKNLFSRLIEVGQGRVDTRRTATYLELVPAGTDDAAVTAIVRALADENVRLITTSGAQGFDEAGTVDIEMATVTIAHEKLIDAWPWLRELVDENREMIALQNQINVDAHEWAKNEDAGFLYRGGRLIQVEEKVSALQPNLDELSSRFVQASLAERERMAKVKRRNQLLAAGAASVIVALIIVALLINSAGQQAQLGTQAKAAAQQAVASTREAEDTQELAVRATAVATAVVAAQASEATAVANVNLVLSSALVIGVQNAGDQELRLLLAVEAVRATTDVDQEPNSAAVEALQQVLSQGLTKSLTTSGDFSNVTGGLQFGGNGKYLSLSRGSNAGTATLVDVRASQVVTLPESVTNISYFDFDDAGRFIAAAGDQKVHVLDAATLQVHCAGLPQGNYTAGMAFNPTGAWLYTYSSSGAGRLWDTQRCTMAGTVPPEPFENTISGGVFIGENRLLSVTEDEQRQRMATYWDLTSSTNPISVYQFEFDSLDISDGGTRLARSFDSLVEVIEIETGETVFKHEFEDINSIKVRLSSDGNYLAVSKTLDNVVYLWDVEARALIRELTAFVDRDRRRGIDFVDVAGQPLLVVQNQYQVELRDATNGELEPSPPNFKPVKIKNVATDPRGQELLIALDDGTIRQWDIVNHQEVTRYSQSIGSFDSMEFSPDSQYLATAKTDGTLRFWTNPSARPVSAEPGASIAVDEAGVRVLAEANDKLVLWDPVGNDFRTIPMTDCEQETLQYSYVIGKRWLITEYDNYEQSECASAKSVLWDMIADPPEPVWEAKDVTLAELSILPAIRADGRLIANSVELPFLDDSVWDLQEEPSGNLSETTDLEEWPLDEYAVQVWDTGNGQSSILPHEAFPEYIALHPTEDFVATADEFGQVLLWQLNGHAEPTSTILLPEDEMLGVALNKLAFDVTGQRLFATYDLLPVLRIWDVANRRVEAEVASISTFTLSPERDIAAVTIVSPTLQVEVWDMNTLDPIASSNINDIQEVSFLEIDSVSTRVAVADGKGNVLIWDWAQPDEAMSQISHSLPVMDMAFTDESNVLVTVIEDGSIQTWILELDGMIKAACEIVSRPLTKNEWNSSIGTAKPWRETCP